MSITAWLSTPSAGREYVYLRAPAPWLAQTREMLRTGRDVSHNDRTALHEAGEALQAYLDGRVELVQRRMDDGTMEYLAIRRNGMGVRPMQGQVAWAEWQRGQVRPIKRRRPAPEREIA